MYQHDPNKRQKLNRDQAISAGLVQVSNETYLTTNIVNISTFDGTPQHGLQANFNQNRTTQIIGNTSSSEIAISSAEIQTKTLPVFQPQVKLGSDPDQLIYEIGYSSVWSGCLLNGAQAGSASAILTNDTEAQIQRQQLGGAPTFQNDYSAVSISDAYNNSFTLYSMDPTVKHTLLKAFIDYHCSSSNALFQNTPLKPVFIPSTYTPIIAMLPLRTEAAPTATPSGTYVAVKDATGFSVGQRVHFFGTSSTSDNKEYSVYAVIKSICLYSDLIVSGAMKAPSDAPNLTTTTVLLFDLLSGMAYTEVRTGGYLINTHIDDDGGRIQFLTDEYEFRQKTVTLYSSTSTSAGVGSLTVTIPDTNATSGLGFLRKNNWPVPVELFSSSQPQINGLYYVKTVSLSFSTYTLVLTPINVTAVTVAANGYSSATAIMKLAPNGYTVDCRTTNSTYATFLNCVGFTPTDDYEICQPEYPPIMTPTMRSFKRAYSVEIPCSAYRNLRWQTQDVDVTAGPPTIQQDFGTDSSSTYYNVYDFQQFINQSVNPALASLITAPEVQLLLPAPPALPPLQQQTLEEQSLNVQLKFVSQAYQKAFRVDPATLVFDSTKSYDFGDCVIYNGFVWTPQVRYLRNLGPSLDNANWFRIGDAPRTTALSKNLVFTYNSSSSLMTFTCADVVNTGTLAERVRYLPTPVFITRPLQFSYDGITNLLRYNADPLGFGMTYSYGLLDSINPSDKYTRSLQNSNYASWGKKNATGQGADETFEFESNSSFKFLFDNFPANAIRYIEPTTNGLLVYWTWSQFREFNLFKIPDGYYIQSSESLSSAVSPVQSIVILSKSIPVVQTLLSPATILSDTNAALVNSVGTVGDSDSILGEFYITPGMLSSCRSVIRYQPEQVTYYSLQSTKTFTQFDCIVCYRHRITQKLVPLNLSNYGSVNIKFVFKPT